MASHSYHVWYLQEAEIPAVVELAHTARASQAVSHVIFRERPGEEIQRDQCERAVISAFNNLSTTSTIVKNDENGEIVAFCIAKRHLSAENESNIRQMEYESRKMNTKSPVSLGELKKEFKAFPGLKQTKITAGAQEYEPPEYPNQSQRTTSNNYAERPVQPRVNAINETWTQHGTFPTRERVPDMQVSSKRPGQAVDPDAGKSSHSKKNENPSLFSRNSNWSGLPSTDVTSRAIYSAARHHMEILDDLMQGSKYIEIEYLWVKPGHRYRGIGSRFVDNCTRQAAMAQVPLYVRAEPTAREFFLRWGFYDTMRFTLNLAQYFPPYSGYGEHQSSWMRWCPPSIIPQ